MYGWCIIIICIVDGARDHNISKVSADARSYAVERTNKLMLKDRIKLNIKFRKGKYCIQLVLVVILCRL